MYIKLTRFDNRPVWLNAVFIVTVEPRRDGVGSVVVPIGDGLDYDVRESTEEVLRLLEGSPEPKVVPVPVSDCLTKTPADVSPEPERPDPVPELTQQPKPVVEKAPEEPVAKSAEKSLKKSVRTRKTAAPKKAKPEKKPVLELSDEEVARLGKMAPKSIAKLKNTLATQFRVEDISGAVAALEAKGILELDGNHVTWKA